MDASFIPQTNHGIMDNEEDLHDFVSSSEASSDTSSTVSSSSDFMEDANSSTSFSPPSSSSPSSDQHANNGPLYEMSSLISQLPFKRGLSKHYQGKSQSFTSLANVKCLEDLAKPESPYKKKLKSCQSYGGGLDFHRSDPPKFCSKPISKKASRSSCASLNSKKSNFLGIRPPIPPHRIKHEP